MRCLRMSTIWLPQESSHSTQASLPPQSISQTGRQQGSGQGLKPVGQGGGQGSGLGGFGLQHGSGLWHGSGRRQSSGHGGGLGQRQGLQGSGLQSSCQGGLGQRGGPGWRGSGQGGGHAFLHRIQSICG